jgi:hypothetical protein
VEYDDICRYSQRFATADKIAGCTFGDFTNDSDIFAFGVGTRVSFGCENDGNCEAWPSLDVDGIQTALNTCLWNKSLWENMKHQRESYETNGGKVSLFAQQKHQSLGLRIAKPNVVLQDLGSGRGEHEPSEENAEERVS